MASTVMDMKQAAGYFGDKLPKEIQQAVQRGLLSAAMRMLQDITLRIIPSRSPQPVDRGIYRMGWTAYSEGGAQPYAIVENTTPHAGFIEYGVTNVKPGAAMISALAEWASRKGIASGEDAKRAAFAIAKNLQRRGIFNGGKGLRVLEEAMTRAPQYIDEEVMREIGRL
jgi:hypothetical protein